MDTLKYTSRRTVLSWLACCWLSNGIVAVAIEPVYPSRGLVRWRLVGYTWKGLQLASRNLTFGMTNHGTAPTLADLNHHTLDTTCSISLAISTIQCSSQDTQPQASTRRLIAYSWNSKCRESILVLRQLLPGPIKHALQGATLHSVLVRQISPPPTFGSNRAHRPPPPFPIVARILVWGTMAVFASVDGLHLAWENVARALLGSPD